MRGSLTVILLLTTCVVMLVGGGYSAVLEAQPFLSSGPAIDDDVTRLVAGVPGQPVSVQAMATTLVTCFDTLHAFAGEALPSEQRRALVQHCGEFARAAASANPTDSYAFFIGAESAAELGDRAGFNAALQTSQRVAPWLGWVAQERFDLARERQALLAAQTQQGFDHDILVLATTPRGLADLAANYAADPDFRLRVIPLIGSLEPAEQQQFVDAVKVAGAKASVPSARPQDSSQ